MFRAVFLLSFLFFTSAFGQNTTCVLKHSDPAKNKVHSICGEIDGDWLIYNPEGKIIAEGPYKNKKKNGKWKEYKDSVEVSFGNYIDDVKNGTWVTKNNKVTVTKGAYKNGEPNGKWKYYYPTGKIMKKGKYKEGMMVGSWDFYSAGGEKTLTEVYH